MRILLVTSTFPDSDDAPTPAFVKELVLALKRVQDGLDIDVLAPAGRRTSPLHSMLSRVQPPPPGKGQDEGNSDAANAESLGLTFGPAHTATGLREERAVQLLPPTGEGRDGGDSNDIDTNDARRLRNRLIETVRRVLALNRPLPASPVGGGAELLRHSPQAIPLVQQNLPSAYTEYRFRYAVPASLQGFAEHGILPTLKARPLTAALLPGLFCAELWAMLRLIRRRRPDVIYAHWFTPQGVTAAIASRLTGVPWVLTSHSNDVAVWRKLPLFGRLIVRTLLPTATAITAVSPGTLSKMQAFFSPDEWSAMASRVRVIPMGIDLAAYRELPLLAAEPGRRPVILFLGRLVEKKGIAVLLRALPGVFNAAGEGKPRPRVVIAGNGPLKSDLERLARDLGLPVEFPGYVTGTAKLALIAEADLVVVPSIDTPGGDGEGFPVVIMEALAAGKILIASDATGAETVIQQGESGFIVPQGDIDALAAALQSALALAPTVCRSMQEGARLAARAFDWTAIAIEHANFLFETKPPTSDRAKS